jgi:hypothetical protein
VLSEALLVASHRELDKILDRKVIRDERLYSEPKEGGKKDESEGDKAKGDGATVVTH